MNLILSLDLQDTFWVSHFTALRCYCLGGYHIQYAESTHLNLHILITKYVFLLSLAAAVYSITRSTYVVGESVAELTVNVVRSNGDGPGSVSKYYVLLHRYERTVSLA